MKKSVVELNDEFSSAIYPLKGEFRNKYHIEVPNGLINDPNGLSYNKGEYNIFFQWNPYTCEHKYKHWGYIKTKDFIRYKKPTIMLAPDSVIDKDGCYSGTGKFIDDKLNIFYTGNVKNNGERIPHQNIAIFNENDMLIKKKPLIVGIPDGYTEHLRDPFYININGVYCMILGAQNKSLKGRVVMYISKDMNTWDFYGEINTKLDDFGYMWECPNLINIDGYDALIFSPQGLEKHEFKYQNLYQSGYILGHYNFENNTFMHNSFYELDYGFDFYAPQVFRDNNRIIMIGWLGMPEDNIEKESPTLKNNYIYTLTMPRVLKVENGRIKQSPLEEIKLLRDKEILENKNMICERHEVNIKNRCLEINLELEVFADFKYILEFKKEKIILEYKAFDNILILDFTNLNKGKNGVRKVKMPDNKLRSIQMFLDVSTLEIFINDGEITMTSSFFAESGDVNLRMSSDKEFKLNSYRVWNMRGFIYE
ncbi:sucrose-6-phosphate hydrolase [Clostridium tertium]|uniref:sucrose-6-phosphate hydrolase n=1 Tax=Clostridium tertium TaxID=1559 RepID=UPI00189DD5C6|nr:sucrose-6-phosphate hydrolase [Clostridium tertium]MDB1946786.1 sucrose-6-phosphate hydrolase [Clostridium tertium]